MMSNCAEKGGRGQKRGETHNLLTRKQLLGDDGRETPEHVPMGINHHGLQ